MKVFVTGVSGQLGHDVMLELQKRGIEALGADRSGKSTEFPTVALDITDREAVEKTLNSIKPDAIIHCAAWTNVDGAEAPENRPLVEKVNVEGTANLAQMAKSLNAKMIYISTDYVFSGEGTAPWTPDDKSFAPLNFYGETKLGGERAVENCVEKFFIVRIAWVFGENGKNFVDTMLRVGKTHDEVKVVNDQIGTPTYCPDLARLLIDMLETEKYGFYHATNEGGYISWADFTKEIFNQAQINSKVVPVSTAEYEAIAGQSVAKRPKNSRLDKSKLTQNGFTPLPTWQSALSRYLASHTPSKNV
ncbi:dTDP-4-dehydrorhamnose reductase [Candidatus Saccharibacteria bacterium]|nr:dTDP-4-dehydrorhamnose reductase [Candidatus Saccharibacteria bacterium]MBQ6130456.1 dTDP-4-dehydrorhamnose reductase [Candidatus Saccharibacteria bacterium]